MKAESQNPNRLAILRRYLDHWASEKRCNRALVAELVVEKFEELHLAEYLPGLGVSFNRSDDLSNDMRTYAQKLWRWLGAYEEVNPNEKALWYVEQAIVAAMPEWLACRYLAETYRACALELTPHLCATANIDLAGLIHEGAEAQGAVLALMDGATPRELAAAENELLDLQIKVNQSLAKVRQLREAADE